MRGLPLRTRLVAGFVVAMLVLLTAAGAFVYWRVQYALDRALDGDLARASSTIATLVGPQGTISATARADASGARWQVLDPRGTVLDAGGLAPSTALVAPGDLALGGAAAVTRDVGDLLPVSRQPLRVRISALAGTEGDLLLVALPRDERDEALRELLVQLAVGGLGALVGAAVVGDLLARAALRPVERYRRRAEEVAGGAGGLRLDVPTDRDDEVTRLGHTLNDMLTALERSLEHERRFVQEASHELRTPVTLLRSRVQLAQRRPRSAEEHRVVLDELAVDVARLGDLAEQLLELGTAGGEATTEPGEVCEVGHVVATAVERRRLADAARAHEVLVERPVTDVEVEVGALALERVVTNLVDNALLHGAAPVGVRVRVRSGQGGEVAELCVSDAGPGMPVDLLRSATGRFTRSAEARARPGSGLGLALVEQLVLGAGGGLRLCHHGEHVVGGVHRALDCEHDDAMTVTVLLPVVRRGTGGSRRGGLSASMRPRPVGRVCVAPWQQPLSHMMRRPSIFVSTMARPS